MQYARNYERCCLRQPNLVQRYFIWLLANKAKAFGQSSHRIWSLKYILEEYFPDRTGIRILDCGAWNGWFLSFKSASVRQRVALDFDAHFAADMRRQGIDFILADMEKGFFPIADNSFDLVVMTSTLEHLGDSQHIASEIRRVLAPSGLVFITTPNVLKYKFHFWDDVTHKRPFTPSSLRFLFESHGLETLVLSPYNHNFFIASNLFPKVLRPFLMRFRGKALLYIGKKPGGDVRFHESASENV